MPPIKLAHVVSFSSEHADHPADNILDPNSKKKWTCKEAGETQGFVIFQLEKASQISAIDVGSHNVAYVEVYVARSDGSKDSVYKTLLPMSTVMSSMESRNSSNVDKVNMFTKDQFLSPEKNEKWDRIKIVCTQPYNRFVRYGLYFVNLHAADDKSSDASQQQKLGKYTLRPPSPDDIGSGSTFLKNKQEGKISPLSAAAAIRDASASPQSFKPKLFNISRKQQVPEDQTPRSRNRSELFYTEDEQEPNEKDVKPTQDSAKNTSGKAETQLENKRKGKIDEGKERLKQKERGATKRRSETASDSAVPKKVRKKIGTPFGELFRDVTIVISGIQNPDRAELRKKAMSMGARYKADWDNTCTHLICAFANTPKFNQVKGKGKIVTRKWIQDSHAQRKRLPWRRYALDKADQGRPESEDEVEEAVTENVFSDEDDKIDVDKDTSATQREGSDVEKEEVKVLDRDDMEKDFLPNLFKNATFHLDTVLNYKDRELLARYIVAYAGLVSKEPIGADVIITSKDNADLARKICGEDALCLSPGWVFECHNMQKRVPSDDFKL